MKKDTTTNEKEFGSNGHEFVHLPLSSIADAEARLAEWDKESDLPDFILDSLEADAEKESGRTIFGSADEYHNLSSEFARNALYNGAASVAANGAKLYKYNVDLLSDVIRFASKSQEWSVCASAFERLESIPRSRWNWRAYTFVIDYLQDRVEIADPSECIHLERMMQKYISSYKKLHDERAWVAEAELYLSKGQKEKAIAVLKDCVEKIRVVPQACAKLSDILLEEGNYNEVIEYVSIGIRSTAQEQPSANIGYLVYVSALAKDAMIHEDEMKSNGEAGRGYRDMERVKDALSDYDLAANLTRSMPFILNIDQRVKILRAKSGIKPMSRDVDPT